MSDRTLTIGVPNEKQKAFLEATAKHVGFGGARGGGKSWVVRAKAILLALHYPGIRILIVRRTYPELVNNHINILRRTLIGIAKYNDKDKVLKFENGSSINFTYCDADKDLDRLQGVEYDIIFLEEATQLSENQMKTISACLRGANSFPKRIYYTFNPGGQGHAYIKRIFIDKKYTRQERAEDYVFIQSLVTDNKVLMESQPDYIDQLKALPPKLRRAWLEGDWNVFEGMVFEEFRAEPDEDLCRTAGITVADAAAQGRFTHVIKPFDIPRGWTIMRSYDFGYSKPFSLGYWAIDYDGVLYRILDVYGWNGTPDEGIKWTPDEQFKYASELERTHPLLKGRRISDGVADPAIWEASRGESIAETAMKHGIYFTPGDHERIPGWMQVHYRLQFDTNGYARMYFFDTCETSLRTLPLMRYSKSRPEDIDTTLEDHCPDEIRYMCMSRPVAPIKPIEKKKTAFDPLDQFSVAPRW